MNNAYKCTKCTTLYTSIQLVVENKSWKTYLLSLAFEKQSQWDDSQQTHWHKEGKKRIQISFLFCNLMTKWI